MKLETIKGTMSKDILSVEDMFLKDLPPGVTLLPKDWEGETTRAYLKFAISDQAIKNEKFDLKGFIKGKFDVSLMAIKRRRCLKELRLKHWLHASIDPKHTSKRTHIYIFLEYAREHELLEQ